MISLASNARKSIFDANFEYMVENSLLSSTQSGFKPNESCNNQLISITHNIFSAFYAKSLLEVFGVFLHLSKVFDSGTIKQRRIRCKKITTCKKTCKKIHEKKVKLFWLYVKHIWLNSHGSEKLQHSDWSMQIKCLQLPYHIFQLS